MYNPQKHEDQEMFIKRLGTIFDTIPSAIIIINNNGEFLYINRQGKEFFGLEKTAPDSLIRSFRLKTFMADGTPYPDEDMPVNVTLKNGETVRVDEMFVENARGVHIPVLMVSAPLLDLSGSITYAYVVIVNMTDRRHAIEKLNFQAHLLSNVQDAISAYDKDMRITFWNEAAEKMYGWTAQEILGEPAYEAFIIEAQKPILDNRIKKKLLERSNSGEVLIRHKNGRLLPTEVHTKVLTDDDGAFKGAVAAFHDITCRKENELKISRQRTLLKLINAIYEKSFSCETLEDLGLSCLEIIESATKSSISFVGGMGEDGLYHDIAVSRNGRYKCRQNNRSGHNWANNFTAYLFEAIMMRKETVLVNDLQPGSGNIRLPDGHPEITSFLGVPFVNKGRVVGIVAAASREGGYTEAEKEMLEALTPSVMEVLLRKRAEEARKKSDERLTFLLNLSDAIRPLTYPDTIEVTASGLLAQHLKTKAVFIKCGEAEKIYEISYRNDLNNEQKEYSIPGLFPEAAGIMRSGKAVIVEDFTNTSLIPAEECERALKYGVRSTVTFPLLKNGELVACLTVSASVPRRWTPLEISLVQETAQRTWTAVEHALAEEALRKREEQFRALVTASSEVLFRMSPDWSVLTQLHGQSVTGNPEKPNSIWLEEYIPVEDQENIKKIIEDASSKKSIIELEHRINTYDGNTGWAYTRTVPLLDSNGDVVEWFGSLIDITGKKKADEQLMKNKLRGELLASITARLLLSENPQQIIYDLCIMAMQHLGCEVFFNYFVDNSRGCLHLNAVTGIPEEDVAKFEWLDFGAAVCGCVAQAGERIIAECIPKTPDKRTVELAGLGIKAYACHPLKTENMVIGTLAFGTKSRETFTEDEIAFMNTVSDYIAIAVGRLLTNKRLKESERKAYELVEQLKKEDQNKNEFLSILSHELRNPLATIIAGISLLDATNDEQQGMRAKDIIKRQSAQLCRLVDDLLDITRITQNKIRLKKERVDLNTLTALATEDMRVQFEKKGVRLERDIPSGGFYIEADPARITQIIGNLLHNSLKFTESGGHVSIAVHKEKEEAVISIKDTGIGLKSELLSRIFQPFIQADESLERSGGGLGLGLAIAKGICDLHGGSINAKSDGLGKGTVFEIRLPAVNGDARQAESSVPEKETRRSLSVLLIEDNKDFAELLCSMLRQIGHDADIACSGHEGLKKVKAGHPDIVFCDIGLPNMNGYEVARLIRADDSIKGVNLVALTGYAAQQDIEYAVKSGFDRHIAKPVSIESLQKVLNQFY